MLAEILTGIWYLNSSTLKYIIIIFFLCFSLKSFTQTIPIRDFITVYKMDASRLELYFDSLKYPYFKAYGDKYLNYLGADTNYFSRIFTDSDKVVRDTYSMLFYRFNNIDEFNECRKSIITVGFMLDSTKTIKTNTNIGDSIECYILDNMEIQLSNNDFKQNIKVVGTSAPMSAFFGQDVHMFSILIRHKNYLNKILQ